MENKSLYEISGELDSIFSELEENGGELTEELSSKLSISEDELYTKLENYCKAIKSFEANAENCKTEKARINAVQNKWKNRIERLKSVILYTVDKYGSSGKNNRFVELPTFRISANNKFSVTADEERIETFKKLFIQYVEELVKNDILTCGEDCDLAGIVSAINAVGRSENPEFVDFTVSDLSNINIEYTCKASIPQLFTSGKELLTMAVNYDDFNDICVRQDFSLNGNIKDASNMSIIKLENNKYLQIR